MSRTVFGNVKNADGTVPAEPVKWELQELIVTEDGIVLPGAYEADLDGTGDFSITLPTPASGSALWAYTYPSGYGYSVQLETGPSVDIATIQTIEEADVAQDDLQTLMDAAAVFTTTNVTTTYQMLTTDEYIRANGTFAITLVPAILTQPPVVIKNIGTGIITVTRAGSDTINGAVSHYIYAGERYCYVPGAAGTWDV